MVDGGNATERVNAKYLDVVQSNLLIVNVIKYTIETVNYFSRSLHTEIFAV